MIGAMRTKMGPRVIGGVIAVIAFVFIFYGIFLPGSGSGSQGPGIAGEVNGEPITYSEFSKELNRRIEFYKSLMKGQMPDDFFEKGEIRDGVFTELAQKKLLVQIAKKESFYPATEQIREQIIKMDVFKKDGNFDKLQYKNVLTANQYSPTQFEELIGSDIMEQNFRAFISKLTFVGPEEVEHQFQVAKNRRKFKFVYIDKEAARKLLSDAKPPEDSKVEPKPDPKLDEKIEKLAEEIVPELTHGADSKVNARLKNQKIEVKTSDWLTAQSDFVPGVGSLKMIEKDLFAMKPGEPAKKFSMVGGTFIAKLEGQEVYNPSSISEKERQEAFTKLYSERQSGVLNDFTSLSMKSATVARNQKVIQGKEGHSVPITPDQ